MDLSTHSHVNVVTATPPATEIATPFHIVIAYDEVAGGERGMEMFVRLRREAAGVGDCHCDLWRFDLLGLPGVSDAALLAGMNAQMIIVAARSDADLPATIRSWLGHCLSVRPAGKALVALLHSSREGGSSASPARMALEMMARRYGVTFFAQETSSAEIESAPTILALRERLARTASRTEGILNRRPRPARWGINE